MRSALDAQPNWDRLPPMEGAARLAEVAHELFDDPVHPSAGGTLGLRAGAR